MRLLQIHNITIAILFLFLGCKQNSGQEKKNIEISQTQAMKRKPITINSIMKLSIKQANDQYGKPFETDRFNVKDGLPEFRIGLYNSFKKNGDVDVFEATWHKTDTTNLTLWYTKKGKEWLPVDYFEWKKGLEF